MANNTNLESQTKVLQSLDLYTNNLLNVSKIVGNKIYPNATGADARSKDLEISTRDLTDNNTGNLLLRAGKATSQQIPNLTTGYVKIFTGADSETASNIPSDLQLNSDGTAVFNEQKTLTLETKSSANSIVLEAGAGQDINKLTIQNRTTQMTGSNQVLIQNGGSNLIKLDASLSDDNNVLTISNGKTDHQSVFEYKLTVPYTPNKGVKNTVFTVSTDTGLNPDTGVKNTTVDLKTARMKAALDDLVVDSDTIKLWTPKTSENTRYIQLNNADSGIEADSGVPGLKIKNDYTDIEADEKLIIYNNAANKIVMAKSGQTGTVSVDTKIGTVTGTESVTVQVPNGTVGSNTHIILNQNGNTTGKKLEIQSADGIETKVITGGTYETVQSGNKEIYVNDGLVDLQASDHIHVTSTSGEITLRSQSASNSSNYLTLNHTDDTLRANNQTTKINSRDTLIIENNPGNTVPENPATNYIKLTGNGQIEEKSGTITDIGTTSITLKADDTNNQIILAKTDGAAENPKSNLLTVQNNYETHKTENEFKILVPGNASINNIHSDSFTATGTVFDIAATTVDNQTSTETKLSSDSINIASMGSVRSQAKRNLYLAAGLGYNSSTPDVLNNNEILIGLKDIESENSIRLSQTQGSKHDVLEVRNSYTRVSTSNYDLTASNTLKIKSSNHGAGGYDRHAAFELDADPTTKAIVKLNDLKVNQSIKLGNIVTGDTTGLDNNPVAAGTASVIVAGAVSKLGLIGADDNLAVQLGGLKLGDNVSTGSAAAGNTLLEVEHANVTGYTRVHNLDITGEIRIGAVASAAATAASGLTKADSSSIGVNFSNFSTVTDTAHAASTSDLIVNVQDLSLNATQTGTINTGSTLDIDSTGALTIDSGTSIGIGTDANKHVPVTIDASNLAISGDKSGSTNNLVIESQSTTYPDVQNNTVKSYVKAEEMHATSDLFVNNVKIWWDSVTNSLVFSKVAIS